MRRTRGRRRSGGRRSGSPGAAPGRSPTAVRRAAYHQEVSEVAGPRGLRQLLDAVMTVGSDLDLPAMLRRIVQSATELVDARYGALGVLDDSRSRLAQFITVGIDDEAHAAIGQL